MPLVSTRELLAAAEAGGYAVGAFNFVDMEVLQAIVQGAREERAPVIVQASAGAIRYAGADYLAALATVAASQAGVPIALHLDHGPDFATAMTAIRAGFTSVMIDTSRYPFAENVARTQEVVTAAHAVGVSVEAELGHIGGVEEEIQVDAQKALLTRPDEAAAFVSATGVDALAVAIGTAHGLYQGTPHLDFERLSAIHQVVKVPLVMHGGSGLPDDLVREAIARGIRKINIDTELRHAYLDAAKKVMAENPEEYDLRQVFGPARAAVTAVVREKIRLFGASGRA